MFLNQRFKNENRLNWLEHDGARTYNLFLKNFAISFDNKKTFLAKY